MIAFTLGMIGQLGYSRVNKRVVIVPRARIARIRVNLATKVQMVLAISLGARKRSPPSAVTSARE